MDEHQRNQIVAHHATIVKDMCNVAGVCDALLSSRVLDEASMNKIMSETTSEDRARALNLRVPKMGKSAYSKYISALQQTGNENIADLLLKPHLETEDDQLVLSQMLHQTRAKSTGEDPQMFLQDRNRQHEELPAMKELQALYQDRGKEIEALQALYQDRGKELEALRSLYQDRGKELEALQALYQDRGKELEALQALCQVQGTELNEQKKKNEALLYEIHTAQYKYSTAELQDVIQEIVTLQMTQDEDQESNAGTPDANVPHPGVTCDGCKQPMFGLRYKCSACPDYDLCSRCENSGIHKNQHQMIKMPSPMHQPCLTHTIGHVLYTLTEGKGSDSGQFNHPRCVAVSPDGSTFYVTDTDNYRVKMYRQVQNFNTISLNSVFVFASPDQDDNQHVFPFGIAVNSFGEVVISDLKHHRIVVCSSDGDWIHSYGSQGSDKGQFQAPVGVALDSSDNVYVCDTNNHRVQVFQRDGVYIRQFGRYGDAQGELKHPWHSAVEVSTGCVFVADTGNNRVSVFSSDGQFVFTFGSQGTAKGQMNCPIGIAIDNDGFVILCDTRNNRVQVFHTDGRCHSTLCSEGDGDEELDSPEGVAVSKNGYLIVADSGNHRVKIFDKYK